MKQENYLGMAIALGAGIGTALGVAVKNIGLFVALGAALGLAIGIFLSRKSQPEDSEKK